MEIEKELAEIKTELKAIRQDFSQEREVSDRLLNSRMILKKLGLKADEKVWRAIRKMLITEYGMSNIEGAGYRIRESQLKKFLEERYV